MPSCTLQSFHRTLSLRLEPVFITGKQGVSGRPERMGAPAFMCQKSTSLAPFLFKLSSLNQTGHHPFEFDYELSAKIKCEVIQLHPFHSIFPDFPPPFFIFVLLEDNAKQHRRHYEVVVRVYAPFSGRFSLLLRTNKSPSQFVLCAVLCHDDAYCTVHQLIIPLPLTVTNLFYKLGPRV